MMRQIDAAGEEQVASLACGRPGREEQGYGNGDAAKSHKGREQQQRAGRDFDQASVICGARIRTTS